MFIIGTLSGLVVAPVESEGEGIVHSKMNILSSFTHPQVVPNLYEFLSSVKHKR